MNGRGNSSGGGRGSGEPRSSQIRAGGYHPPVTTAADNRQPQGKRETILTAGDAVERRGYQVGVTEAAGQQPRP